MGAALLLNRFVPMALLIEIPISVNIVWLKFRTEPAPVWRARGLEEGYNQPAVMPWYATPGCHSRRWVTWGAPTAASQA